VFILGSGSNTLFPDEGFPGLVIRITIKGRQYEEASGGDARCIVGAGESWDGFVAETVSQGLWGLENLSSIPGTVGASPVQNVGAYGVEVAELIDWVEVLNKNTHELHVLSVGECGFSYRDSVFKHEEGAHLVVTRVAFRLKTHSSPRIVYKDLALYLASADHDKITPGDVRVAVADIRARKLPDPAHVGTAGSFFKNPVIDKSMLESLEHVYGPVSAYVVDETHVKIPAAWLLEKLGWKGRTEGHVGCWERQPLCLVHLGGGTTEELLAFVEELKRDVYGRAGITLEPEVCIVRTHTNT
jgi:UDP-N-acetylmuramate dehydrogenase